MTRNRLLIATMCGLTAAAAACADITSSSSKPESIEFQLLSAPAVVIGDTLRDLDGLAAPIIAVARNQRGEVLEDAVIRYTYADAVRDSALLVDELRGFVVARRALSGPTARIAARVGNDLQIVRTVFVTTRPDSVGRETSVGIDTLRVTLPDNSDNVSVNTSSPLTVAVTHIDTTSTRVPNWLVKYELLYPSNPTNDSTKSAFLVNDQKRLSNIDTTDVSGTAARFVRVRSSQFPTGAVADTAVVVQATVTYKGKAVKGSPVKFVIPVIKKP